MYWIRRITLLLAVGTLIFGIWWLATGRAAEEQAGPSPEASQSAAPASAEPTQSAPAPQSPSATEEASSTGAPVDCQDSSIKVKARTDKSTYVVGETPVLKLTITNIGDTSCKRDVGPKANELEVTSGGYHVWSSDDCSASDASKVMVMKPGEKVSSSITWNGRLSQKGCPSEGAEAKAGRYDVIGRNGAVESDGNPFSLTKAE